MALFITFEGIEGSGKTTQIKLLSKYLKSKGIKHALTREPGGTPLGDKLRKLVLIPKFKSIEPQTELFIMLAARSDHVARVVKKNLDRGIAVICDRFTDASIAYQGGGRGIDQQLIVTLNDFATANIRPDLTLLFDLPIMTGLKRAKKRLSAVKAKDRESRFENEALKFHKRVRNTYLRIQRNNKKRVHLIDATKNVTEIHQTIKGIVDNAISSDKRAAKGRKGSKKIRTK